MRRWVRILLWVVSAVAAALFLLAGVPKLMAEPATVEMFAGWGYSATFLRFIGAVEIVGACLLLVPRLARYGAGLLLITMAGAAYTHLANGEGLAVLRPIVFAAGLAFVLWGRFRPAVDASAG